MSNPVFFNGPTPTEDGLLSNEIFGITKTERAGIYAYINLGSQFIQPLILQLYVTMGNGIMCVGLLIMEK